MNILQINTADKGGGAEGSAFNLFKRYREAGHTSWLAVGTKYTSDPDVFEIPRLPAPGLLNALSFKAANLARTWDKRGIKGMRRLARILDRYANPMRLQAWRQGREEYDFPGCSRLLGSLPGTPDIIHCHNLHGWFFDLRLLAQLSSSFPVVLNLRDTWLLTGHCAYFMDCTRWKEGCGSCPALNRYPAIQKDATAQNWLAKKQIYQQSRLFVTAPSQWLIDQAKASMLNAAEYKVIPNGIDTTVFRPLDQQEARKRLQLPPSVKIAMVATASPKNLFKDPKTLCETLHLLAQKMPELHFLCVGTDLGELHTLPNMHRFPYISSPEKMADCYRASDLFIHTAHAEAFGKTVTEAMACGTPVVATAVGGITEQVIQRKTGFLAAYGNAEEHAMQALKILMEKNEENRQNMRMTCASHASGYSLDRQQQAFLNWYAEIITEFHHNKP